jgi:hypothetical protein
VNPVLMITNLLRRRSVGKVVGNPIKFRNACYHAETRVTTIQSSPSTPPAPFDARCRNRPRGYCHGRTNILLKYVRPCQ